jgi:hypothetical protein
MMTLGSPTNPASALTLRCRGLRITNNDRQHGPVNAQVGDGERLLAGPFDRLDRAVAWIQARRPPHRRLAATKC